jgi:uncharacterized OB-fold protein
MTNADPGREGGRPLPVPDETSAPFWAAAARHVLTLARCSDCGAMTLPPDITCPNCFSTNPRFTFEPVEGRGRIRTWTVMHRSFLNGFDLPFVLVDVELADHPKVRIIGRLLDGPEAPLSLGAPVSVAFEDLAPDVAVPAFRLEAGR